MMEGVKFDDPRLVFHEAIVEYMRHVGEDKAMDEILGQVVLICKNSGLHSVKACADGYFIEITNGSSVYDDAYYWGVISSLVVLHTHGVESIAVDVVNSVGGFCNIKDVVQRMGCEIEADLIEWLKDEPKLNQ